MTIGDRIKKARKDEGLSLEKLGARLGVTRQLVWQWERDDTDPSKHIEALSEHLNRPIEYFYGEQPKPAELAQKIARLSQEQQDLIRMMVDKMLDQADPPPVRKSAVK